MVHHATVLHIATVLFTIYRMGISVRRALASDVKWVLSELKKFAKFTGVAHCEITSNERTRAKLLALIEGHYFIVADEVHDEFAVPVGFLAAYEMEHPFFEGKRWLCECFWWVTESARGSTAGAKLFAEYLKHAHSTPNIDTQVTIALEEQSPVKQSSLEKRGFKLVERSFVLEIPAKGAA